MSRGIGPRRRKDRDLDGEFEEFQFAVEDVEGERPGVAAQAERVAQGVPGDLDVGGGEEELVELGGLGHRLLLRGGEGLPPARPVVLRFGVGGFGVGGLPPLRAHNKPQTDLLLRLEPFEDRDRHT